MNYRGKEAEPLFPLEKIRRINQKTRQIIAGNVSRTDPDGSYTGVPIHPGEVPVQDVDDL